jgi:hypothetical protein
MVMRGFMRLFREFRVKKSMEWEREEAGAASFCKSPLYLALPGFCKRKMLWREVGVVV